MALSFDPDWKAGGWSSNTTTTLATLPAGVNGEDTVIVFLLLDDDVTIPGAVQRNSVAGTQSYPGSTAGPLTLGIRAGMYVDTRMTDLTDIRFTFTSAVSGAYVVGNFPKGAGAGPFLPGGYTPQSTSQPDAATATIGPPIDTVNLLVGMGVADGAVTITPLVGGGFDSRGSAAFTASLRAFALETTDPAATLEAAGTLVRHTRLQAAVANLTRWTAGRVAWGGRGAWH